MVKIERLPEQTSEPYLRHGLYKMRRDEICNPLRWFLSVLRLQLDFQDSIPTARQLAAVYPTILRYGRNINMSVTYLKSSLSSGGSCSKG